MVRRGAKHLILLNRSGATNDAARSLLQELRDQGAQVEAPPCDISKADVVASVLTDLAQRMPPVKGCIQSSMVLKVCTSLAKVSPGPTDANPHPIGFHLRTNALLILD